MGRIRILSDNVANKIAAGEVVERPASVAKELLENSLDAGATEVRLDAENAGRRLLRIQDNGSGMLRDDALLAFERHATSKLSDVKDLLAIATLGFRGEALPSIASVSRLLLETRAATEQIGTAVEIVGGKLLRCDEIALPTGTTITVRDLFYNVPARKKFLRSDQTELAHIGSLVTHYSLGHADKRFELFHEGRTLLSVAPVGSLRERAFQVFGSETLEGLTAIEPTIFELKLPVPYVPPPLRNSDEPPPEPERSEFALEGLISGPHVQKLNRNSVFLFVNGRLIRDKVIMHAITAAYHNLMPAGCYPFALLFLGCDPSEVDVNVHPSKTEVRFRHGSAVHDFVRDTIRRVLIASRPVSGIPLPTSPQIAEPRMAVRDAVGQNMDWQRAARLPLSEFSAMTVKEWEPVSELSSPELAAPVQATPIDDEAALPEITRQTNGPLMRAEVPLPAAANAAAAADLRRVPDTHRGFGKIGDDWNPIDTLAALPDLRPLGQLHESFIVAAGRDGLWIIDQHVAHERILFEQVLRQRAAGTVEVQQLLMPVVLQLTPAQQFEYARIADELNSYGFETEPFGQRTIAIKASPAGVNSSDIEKIIFEILEVS
ncbi:MAG TPA: DNA mismatch repair endonuclease MutL, partial [Bryobacteraceae bacterium]|nr:DNA mismatch repair endonuclease MutL [Bryobacteraceae bacterium]